MTGHHPLGSGRAGEPAEETDPSSPAVTPAGLSRRAALRRVPQRLPVVLSVLVVLAVVGLISIVARPSGPSAAPAAADGVPVAPVGAYSSSAFCTAGTGTAASATIYLTNPTRHTISGVMISVGPSTGSAVPSVRRTVSVPALRSAAVNPGSDLPTGSTATSFVFAGGGMVVNQSVSGPGGWSMAPCASRTATQWSFAGGSTASGNLVSLALFNPAATEAVVNVSFLTGNGLVTPQDYQGLEVPAGQLVVENVGDYVQNVAAFATVVSAQAGAVVSTEFQQWAPGATGGISLRLGSPVPSTTWRFAQTTTLPGSTVDFTLGNPGTASVTASISVGLSSGTVVPHQVVVPPLSVTVFTASTTAGLPQQTPFSLTVTSSGPMVVGRSVSAPTGATAATWGASAGTVSAAGRWVVPGPGVPNSRPSRVRRPPVWPWPTPAPPRPTWRWSRWAAPAQWPSSPFRPDA